MKYMKLHKNLFVKKQHPFISTWTARFLLIKKHDAWSLLQRQSDDA